MKEYVVLIFTINVDDEWIYSVMYVIWRPIIINIDSEDEDTYSFIVMKINIYTSM